MFSQLTPAYLNAWTIFWYKIRLETETNEKAISFLNDQLSKFLNHDIRSKNLTGLHIRRSNNDGGGIHHC